MFNNFPKKQAKLHYLLKKTDMELLYSLANPFSKKDDIFLQKIKKMKNKIQEQNKNNNNALESNNFIKPKPKKSTVNQIVNSEKKSKFNQKRNPDNLNDVNGAAYKRVSQSLPKNVKVADLNILSKLYKIDRRYNKIINGELDKELVVRDKIRKFKRLSKNDKILKTESDLISKKIYRLIKVDNHTFNNCIINDKTIYDIKPLNKLDEKGRCTFPIFNEEKEKINETEPNIISKDFRKRNINNNFLIKNSTTYSQKSNNSEKNLDIKNNICSPSDKNERKFKRKINLKDLYNELPKSQQTNNLKIFYLSDGSAFSRGAKIKFLKTTYPVEMIKPLSTQKSYKLIKGSKAEKKFDKIIKRYEANHYALDVKKRKNMIQINQTNIAQKNIINKIKNEFLILDKQLFDKNYFNPEELPDLPVDTETINVNLGKI